MSRHGGSRGGRDRGFLGILSGLGLGAGAVSIGGAAAAIGATWKVTEALVKGKKLFDVRSENAVFVRITERVKIDLVEVERLMGLKEVKEALRHNRPKTIWVGEKIKDVNQALEAMHKYTRKVAGAGWWLGLKTRLWWIMDEYEKLIHREMELGYAREGLLAVIEYLNQFENNPAKEKEKEEQRTDTRRTTVTKNVDVDVDVDVERRGGRRVIENDREGRSMRNQRERHEYIHRDEYVVEQDEDEYVEPQWRASARDGFYDGRLDGPLATRPTWWAEQNGLNRSDEYIKRRTVVEEKTVERDVPLRVHWPTKL